MAIKYTVALPSGLRADYHRIIGYNEDLLANIGYVDVALYADKSARVNDKEPVIVTKVAVPLDMVETLDVRESVYPYLKETELIGGEDV